MISNELLLNTIKHLKTTDAMYEFIYEMDRVFDYLFKSTSHTPTEIIDQHMSSINAEYLKKSLKDMSLAEVNTTLKTLVEDLRKTPKYGITLAFKYDNSFMETVYTWVSTNLSNHYLIEFSYDPEIIGGGVFVYDGLYRDYSLKNELIKFFESKDGLQKFI